MWYIDEWKDKTNASVLVGEEDAPALTDSNLNAYKVFLGKDKIYSKEYSSLKDGDTLKLGENTLNIIATPGHTRGGISILADNAVFVGDTVFSKQSIGRTDLPGGDYNALLNSIKKIISLPPDTVLYPGHGESRTVYEIIN